MENSISKLFEASVKGESVHIAMDKIISYLNKKLEVKLVKIPGIEHYHNSADHGYGIRYVINGSTHCIRFNWHSESNIGKSADLASIDLFLGKRDPSFNIHTRGISMVRILPALVNTINSPSVRKEFVFPVDINQAMNESFITEAKRDDFTAQEALDDFISRLANGKTYTRSDFIGSYHIVHVGIFDTVFRDFADKVTIKGKQVSFKPGINLGGLKDSILSRAGVLEVTRGGTKEAYLKSKEEEAAEQIEEHVPFADTLDHLEGLVSSVIKGAFNALFVAGRGGSFSGSTPINIIINDNKDLGNDKHQTEDSGANNN